MQITILASSLLLAAGTIAQSLTDGPSLHDSSVLPTGLTSSTPSPPQSTFYTESSGVVSFTSLDSIRPTANVTGSASAPSEPNDDDGAASHMGAPLALAAIVAAAGFLLQYVTISSRLVMDPSARFGNDIHDRKRLQLASNIPIW
ncbi:hypothetical protein BKA70DRAFT_1219915 [Coprinopsis sp. MPI-PUGE-AT-0042]|nr:hypothetical protein BKA70DRAFT_1219915 [Coprinopsis sp. MPI-PUGE-AT-0042]